MTRRSTATRLDGWALVLGASSGFGAASCVALARTGLDVYGIHLDRKATAPAAERVAAEIRAAGRRARSFDVNAADPERRVEVLDAIERVQEADRAGGTLLVALAHPETHWLTGNVIGVDGGEDIVG